MTRVNGVLKGGLGACSQGHCCLTVTSTPKAGEGWNRKTLYLVLCPRKGQGMRFRQCFQSDKKEESTLHLAGFSRPTVTSFRLNLKFWWLFMAVSPSKLTFSSFFTGLSCLFPLKCECHEKGRPCPISSSNSHCVQALISHYTCHSLHSREPHVTEGTGPVPHCLCMALGPTVT